MKAWKHVKQKQKWFLSQVKQVIFKMWRLKQIFLRLNPPQTILISFTNRYWYFFLLWRGSFSWRWRRKKERGDDKERPNGSAFIVYCSCQLMLLNRYLNCIPPAFIKKVIIKSSAICVHLICQNGHDVIWWSQPIVNRYYLRNLRRSATDLFNSNTY